MVDADELQQLAVDIAREAEPLARRRRDEGVRTATKPALADIVTEADREVEQLIRDRLAQARPDDGFLGEESGAERGTSGVTWVVDPIDGTVNYAYGIPHYAVSIAAVSGEPTPAAWTAETGVVYTPAVDELFHATRGGRGLARLPATGRVDGRGCRCPPRHRVRLRPGDACRRPRARAASHAACIEISVVRARPRSTWRSSLRADWTATSSADSGRGSRGGSPARHRGGWRRDGRARRSVRRPARARDDDRGERGPRRATLISDIPLAFIVPRSAVVFTRIVIFVARTAESITTRRSAACPRAAGRELCDLTSRSPRLTPRPPRCSSRRPVVPATAEEGKLRSPVPSCAVALRLHRMPRPASRRRRRRGPLMGRGALRPSSRPP